MRSTTWTLRIALSALWVVICLQALWGQATSGIIQGQIFDPQGALVPSADVRATNINTNVTTGAKSNDTGFYLFPRLLPGTYSVEITAAGFQHYLRQNVVVSADSIVRVDARLEVGASAETVTITAASPVLKTDRVDVSTTLESRQINELPLMGRNISFLLNTVPGTIATGRGDLTMGDVNLFSNGQDNTKNYQTVDGVDNHHAVNGNGSLIVTSAEAVQEVKITTNSYDAEYGQAGGSMTQVITKGGTNQRHGSLFEYLRNNALAARDPFADANSKIAPLKYNQFGGTIGGPIKKDKIFYFGSYEGWRVRQGSSGLSTVPMPAFRQGDFSAWGSQYPIYDPATGDANGNGRSLFPSYTIPASRVNSAARKILDLFPAPNVSTTSFFNNYYKGYSSHIEKNQYMGRIDWMMNDKSQLFGRFTYDTTTTFTPTPLGEPLQPYSNNRMPNKSLTLSYIRAITNNLVLEVRGGFTRAPSITAPSDVDKNVSEQFGIPNVNTRPEMGGLIAMSVGGPVGGFNIGANDNSWYTQTNTTYTGGFSYNHGRHTMKFGAEKRDGYFSSALYAKGKWTFTQTPTAAAGVSNSGIALASFMIGNPNSISWRRETYGDRMERQNRDGYYWQDQFRINPKLTLIYGIRYEYLSPVWTPLRAGGTQYNLNFNVAKVDIANVGPIDRYADIQKDLNNFGPRLGVAYRFAPKMVFRAGYGRMYTIGGWGESVGAFSGQWPTAPNLEASADNPYYGMASMTQGPPPLPKFPDLDPSGQMRQPSNQTVIGQRKDDPTGYTDSWNAAIQHEFLPNWNYEIAYVGNSTTHLWMQRELNGAYPGPGSFSSRQPYYIAYGINGSVIDRSKDDHSNYHSLQTKLEKRFWSGYTVGSAFTWGKNLIQTGGWAMQDPWCRTCNKTRNGYDVARVWRFWGNYELPFGKGKRFLPDVTGVARHMVEGWGISTLTTWRSGWPINPNVGNSSALNAKGAGGWRADRIGSGKMDNPTTKQWFKLSDFAIPNAYTFGNSGGYVLDGPATFNSDVELAKTWYLSENKKLKFRAAGYNGFNVVQLNNPWESIDNPLGGQIISLSGSMRRVEFGLNLAF